MNPTNPSDMTKLIFKVLICSVALLLLMYSAMVGFIGLLMAGDDTKFIMSAHWVIPGLAGAALMHWQMPGKGIGYWLLMFPFAGMLAGIVLAKLYPDYDFLVFLIAAPIFFAMFFFLKFSEGRRLGEGWKTQLTGTLKLMPRVLACTAGFVLLIYALLMGFFEVVDWFNLDKHGSLLPIVANVAISGIIGAFILSWQMPDKNIGYWLLVFPVTGVLSGFFVMLLLRGEHVYGAFIVPLMSLAFSLPYFFWESKKKMGQKPLTIDTAADNL